MSKRQPFIAIVGAGNWGKNLVRNFYQIGVLKTVCDFNIAVCQQISRDYPNVCVTDAYEALLDDDDITGIVIATSAVTHFDLAQKALLANKHVFVEKPLSLNYSDGEKLVSLAANKQKIIFVGHILHYHPAIVKLKEMVKSGTIGRLQYIYSRRLSLGKIRQEENILWSFAPHDISVILSITGEEPNYVESVGSNFLHAQIPDVTMTNLKFPSGIGAHIFVSWLNPYKEQRLVVIGQQGMMVFDDTQPISNKLVFYPHKIEWKNGIPVPEKADGIVIDISGIWEEPLSAECQAFLKSINSGQTPLTSGDEGLRVLRVLEISQKSLENKERASTSSTLSQKKSTKKESKTYFADPSAIIDENVQIGKKTKIWHFSHILSGSKIGDNCNIGQNVVIGPDVTIGNNCKIQNNVSVYKGVTLEDGVFCGPSVVFTNVYNPRAEIPRMDHMKPIIVKKGATLGANCTIVCGYNIGKYAFIGAGAVVTKDVPDNALMVGNPAKQIGWICRCGGKINENGKCNDCGEVILKKI